MFGYLVGCAVGVVDGGWVVDAQFERVVEYLL